MKGCFLEVKGRIRQIYRPGPKGVPGLLGIDRESAPCPPTFSLHLDCPNPPPSLIGVIVTPPQSNDRERESCETPPHQTINQAY